MKRKNILLITLLLMAIGLCVSFASATTDEGNPGMGNISFSNPFKWATSSPPDYIAGLVLGLLGAAGALVAIYFSIGFVLPGTAGKVLIEEEMDRLRTNEKILDGMMKDPNCKHECLNAKQMVVDNHRNYITRERWKQFLTGFPLYIFLGGFFASMLATDLIQAIFMGFGWTMIVGSLGLKSDFQYRKDEKDVQLDAAVAQISEWKETIGVMLLELEKHTNDAAVQTAIINKIKKALNAEPQGETLAQRDITLSNVSISSKDQGELNSLIRKIGNMQLKSRKTITEIKQVKKL